MTRLSNRVILVLLLMATPSLISALSVTDAIRMKWKSSEILTTQRAILDATNTPVFRRFLPSSPQFQVTQGDDGTWSAFGASTTIAFPFKAAGLSQSDALVRSSQTLETQAKEYDVAALVAQSTIDYAVINAQLKAQTGALQDLETLEKSIQSLYQQGYASLSDTIGVRLQVSQVQAELIDLKGRESDARRRLETILGVPISPTTSVTLDDDLDPEIVAQLHHPSGVSRAQSALKLAESTQQAVAWQWVPDLMLGVQRNAYTYLPASPSGTNSTLTYTASITVPLFAPISEDIDRRRQELAAKLDAQQAIESLKLAEADVVAARQEYERKKSRLQHVRETELPLAEAQVATTFTAYKIGKSGFSELIQARKMLIDLKLYEIQLRSNVMLAHLRCL